jgi:hypothetical protein
MTARKAVAKTAAGAKQANLAKPRRRRKVVYKDGRKWIEVGRGVLHRVPTRAEAVVNRQRRAEDARWRQKEQDETCGLGYRWERPDDWDTKPFSHTVTMVEGISAGYGTVWSLYNSGVVATLAVHAPGEPYERGHPYVWCKTVRNGNGAPGTYPSAPVFGRFIEATPSGPRVLVANAKAEVLGPEYNQCFCPVGHVGRGEEFFPRSEVPVPVPSQAVRQDLPVQLDALQRAVKSLDDALTAMARTTDMVDELDDHDGGSEARHARRAEAYGVLDNLLTMAMQNASNVREGLDECLKASPELAYWLSRWQRKEAPHG